MTIVSPVTNGLEVTSEKIVSAYGSRLAI